MDSSLFTFVHSVLNRIEDDSNYWNSSIGFYFMNLKMFILSAGKLGNDESMASFLVKIEDSVPRHFGEQADEVEVTIDLDMVAEDFVYLAEEMREWYITILNSKRQSSSPSADEIVEILTTFLEAVEISANWSGDFDSDIISDDQMAELVQSMNFLKYLIPYFTQWNVETGEVFLALSAHLAIAAAAITIPQGPENADRFRSWMRTSGQCIISIKNPEFYEAYTEALRSLKSVRRLNAPTDQDPSEKALLLASDMLKALVLIQCQKTALNHGVLLPLMDQLQELFEGLKSLQRTTAIPGQFPNLSTLKMQEDIKDLVCDAGVFIFSLCQTHVQLDLGLLRDMLESIKNIRAECGVIDPQSSTQLAFIDFLLENLTDLRSSDASDQVRNCAQTIHQELVSLRSLLEHVEELHHEDDELQVLRVRVSEVAYMLQNLIDCYLVDGDPQHSHSPSFDHIKNELRSIKLEIKLKTPAEGAIASQSSVQSAAPLMTEEVVGFRHEAKSIIDRLLIDSKKLQIMAIVGMPGSGKTTLAEKICNDRSIKHHFHVCAFTTVSQTVDKRKVFLGLLKRIAPGKYQEITSDAAEHEAADQLRRSLKGRPYLVVLDDVWDAQALQSLLYPFQDDRVGSRILLTSRHHDVVADECHILGEMNEEESLSLLQSKLSEGNDLPTEFANLKEQIVKVCHGLPLSIVTVAGVLKSMKPVDWEKFLDKFGSLDLSKSCENTLELSYKFLPHHLKPCLLYFSSFAEDEEVPVRRLLHLWMGEGFIRKVETKCQEDVAGEYLQDLIGRSLVMVAKRNTRGRVKACRVHDLVREFCLLKAKDEHFYHFIHKGNNELLESNDTRHLRRLFIHSGRDFVESSVFCSQVRSLRFSWDFANPGKEFLFVFNICKHLRVLDMEEIEFCDEIISEIGLLVRLVYLAITVEGREPDILPSLCNLRNLETLIMKASSRTKILLPEQFWSLRRLKRLYLRSAFPGILPMKNLDIQSDLLELDRISSVVIPYYKFMQVVKKFPNIRRLKCFLKGFGNEGGKQVEIVVSDCLNRLESLSLSMDRWKVLMISFEFSLPANLKKLTLVAFPLSERSLSHIGKLPNLEVLKLHSLHLEGYAWRMKEGEFKKLRILKLCWLNLEEWSGCDDDQFQCLEKLKLERCYGLKEMPSCLKSTGMLQLIKVNDCSSTVTELVKEIEEQQVDFGNTDLKIIIREEEDSDEVMVRKHRL